MFYKNLKYSLFIILINYCSLFSQKIDYNKLERLNVDLNGVVELNDIQIMYGSNGSLVYFDKLANNWMQKNLNDTINILHLYNDNNKLHGIVLSHNFQQLYEIEVDFYTKKYILLPIDFKFANLGKIIYQKGNYLFGTKSSIYKYNLITKEVKSICKDSQNPSQLFYDFINIDTLVFVPSYNNELYKFNISSNHSDKIISDKFSFNQCSIVNFKNNIYVLSDSMIYCSKDFGNKWDFLTKVKSNTKLLANDSCLYIVKFDSTSNDYIHILTKDGLNFNYEINANQKYFNNIRTENVKKIFTFSNNISYAIGDKKLILKYINEAWDIISFLRSDYYYLNVKFNTPALAYTFSRSKEITISNDSGVTWKPIQNNLNEIWNNQIKSYEFIFNRNESFNNIVFSITHDRFTENIYKNNMYVSLKNANNFKIYSFNFINIITLQEIYNYNHYSFVSTVFSDIDNQYTEVYSFDSNYNIKSKVKFDSLWVHKLYQFNNNLELISSERRYYKQNCGNVSDCYDSTNIIIKQSSDNGQTWNDKIILYELNKMKLLDIVIKDNIRYLLVTKDENKRHSDCDSNVYLYKIVNDKLIYITKVKDLLTSNMFVIGKNLYLNSQNKTYYLTGSDSLESFYNPTPFTIISQNDNSYIVSTFNSLLINDDKYNIYKYTDESPTSVVEAQIEDLTDLVTLNPSPLPANTFTKIGVIWSPIYKFDLSNIEVYDIYGVKVKSNLKTSLREFDTFRGELTIQTEDLPDGVFFIKISHGITTKYVKILVSH
ncbi:MAG: hypothetical protein NTW25_04515 [Candidatus Kapabacteria bacterium]|nr:hypothetical protein [Candidatus Kapabacteria bacterium]